MNVQVVASKQLGSPDDPYRQQKYRMILWDGETTYKLAVFDATASSLPVPADFSIITISDQLRPIGVKEHFVNQTNGKTILVFSHFLQRLDGQSVGQKISVERSFLSSPAAAAAPATSTPTAPARPSTSQQTPSKLQYVRPSTLLADQRPKAKRKLEMPVATAKVMKGEMRPTHTVADLNPYVNKYKLKVLIESKSDVRSLNTRNYSGPVQDCILSDSSGRIKLTAWNQVTTHLVSSAH